MKRDQASMPSIRTPVQQRSRDKFERIFTATETLFVTKGPQSTSIQDIIEEAGCSVGAFYQRFPDRDALITAVLERFEDTVNAAASSFFDDATLINMPLGQMVEEVVNFAFRLYALKGGLFRALTPLLETSPAARQGRTCIITFTATKFGTILMQRKTEFAHPDPLLAANIVTRMLVGMLDTCPPLSGKIQEDYEMPLETIQTELKRCVKAYLGIPQRSK
jgi:AcrR family transcriptional regulator